MVGESGCGKSTLARVVMGLYPPDSGEIYYRDQRIDQLTHEEMLPFRKKVEKYTETLILKLETLIFPLFKPYNVFILPCSIGLKFFSHLKHLPKSVNKNKLPYDNTSGLRYHLPLKAPSSFCSIFHMLKHCIDIIIDLCSVKNIINYLQ